MARVGLRVALGDLRSVGGPVDHELFIAARLPDRLDVGDGVGGRVVGSFGADLGGAFGDLLAPRPARAQFEAVAGQGMGQANPALVEHDQIARGRDRPELTREVFGERDRRLAGPAREREDRVRALRRRARGDGASRA